ncbi:DUF3889 domain-containing protein [Bacillus suaedaesalsae]|uniref:DUF3889 domain-containing protein n=1 Tax=Bacillus suaedaesalsae TaxID=2810349 RepID=A0ABS2DF22_9BACI|nr:DUF3889 domain-containing protein [Bacillus suaedaesalsae]MBM6617061.1 DUF3889 domain-containing protein [Bacillus suaedaesalsae]
MHKRIALPLISFAFIIGLMASYTLQDYIGIAQEPDYAKWGNMAITIVKENYPDAEVKEYKYEGRKAVNVEKAEDSFTFDVKKGTQPVKVKVVVTFNPKLNSLVTLSLEEIKQQ